MEALRQFLRENSNTGLLPWSAQVSASHRFGLSFAEVEDAALASGCLPKRYQRNPQTISIDNQLKLFRSRVAVVGCGGLGGYIIEELARLGVGTIVAVDPDVFEEHNLNRQALSTMAGLGCAKVCAAKKRVVDINPAVKLLPVQAAYSPQNAKELFAGANVVVDALDAIPTRLALAESCKELSLPLVHGAIAGWYGQVATQFPGDDTLEQLYGRQSGAKGVEMCLGNPSFTPAVVASLETAEVCKILLHTGKPLRKRMLLINLLEMTFDEVKMSSVR